MNNPLRHIIAFIVCLSPLQSSWGSSLDSHDRLTALETAEKTQWQQSVTNHAPQVLDTRSHPLGVQTLSIEKREQKNAQADSDKLPLVVYQFHYEHSAARMVIVDTVNQSVLQVIDIPTVHLPLNAQEILFARQLLSQQTGLITALQQEQLRSGRTAFEQFDEIFSKASIYQPLEQAHPCARQRCALMSLVDNSNTVFSIEPVVNLQTLQVSLLADK